MTTNIYGSEENQKFEKLSIEIGGIGEGNFKHFIIVPEDETELEDIVRKLKENTSLANTALTIIAKKDFKENECIKELKDNINILFNDNLATNHDKITGESGEEVFFKKFRNEKIQHVNYDLNPNFEKSGDVSVNDDLAKQRQDTELLAAAHRFIAFEYYDDEKNAIKPKYNGLDLKKIHSSFEVESKVIDEARDAVCGGKYDKKTLNQAKKKSIYSGVDKFKASIDGDGYLVIQSVSDSINDEHFKKGVKTNFKFEEFTGTEITQDNLKDLFTNGSYGKDSGLSVLGAIEQAFQALKTIEKGNDGQLIKPKNSEQFNAIFPEYGETRRVQPELDDSATPATPAAPPPPPPAAEPPEGSALPAPAEPAAEAAASEAAAATPATPAPAAGGAAVAATPATPAAPPPPSPAGSAEPAASATPGSREGAAAPPEAPEAPPPPVSRRTDLELIGAAAVAAVAATVPGAGSGGVPEPAAAPSPAAASDTAAATPAAPEAAATPGAGSAPPPPAAPEAAATPGAGSAAATPAGAGALPPTYTVPAERVGAAEPAAPVPAGSEVDTIVYDDGEEEAEEEEEEAVKVVVKEGVTGIVGGLFSMLQSCGGGSSGKSSEAASLPPAPAASDTPGSVVESPTGAEVDKTQTLSM